MSAPHGHGTPHVEIADGTEALRKTEEFARKVLAVPKKKIDALLAKEKSKYKRKPH